MTTNKQFILVQVGKGVNKPIYGPRLITLVQSEKKRLKNSVEFKGYNLQIRTVEGYSNVKVLKKKK
jgi:hypothetical protein